ncbi:MAG: short chain dehydrogenase [Robiginitomaculum sp.]|nr:MAG: short chain dehydrogenase [Robiginitomaculum sp.]
MKGKTVIITGGGSGIGAALARQYAKGGYNLAILDINMEGANAVAKACRQIGAGILVQECDVTSPQSCTKAVEETLAHFGHIDVVIANAGLTHLSLLENTDLSVIRRVMEVNFFGAINIVKAALPALLGAKGQVIAMSSVAGFCPLPMRTGYAASKYAVRGFFETLRTETRHRGLGIMIVCPSYVDTKIGDNALGGHGEKATHQRSEAKGAISADDAAKAIFIAAGRRRDFLTIGKGATLAHILSRIAPSFLEKLSTKRVLNTSS